MELLLAVLLWIGVITQPQTGSLSQAEAMEMFNMNSDIIELEYPDEYNSIIGTYDEEVN